MPGFDGSQIQVKKFLLKSASRMCLFLPSSYTVSQVTSVGEKPETFKDFEQDVFKALENQKRRDILRLIGEKKGVSFTEVLNASKIPDSPTLSYHLRELSPFVEQKKGKYQLTPMGKDAYSLLLKTAAYGKVVLFQKKRY